MTNEQREFQKYPYVSFGEIDFKTAQEAALKSFIHQLGHLEIHIPMMELKCAEEGLRKGFHPFYSFKLKDFLINTKKQEPQPLTDIERELLIEEVDE